MAARGEQACKLFAYGEMGFAMNRCLIVSKMGVLRVVIVEARFSIATKRAAMKEIM